MHVQLLKVAQALVKVLDSEVTIISQQLFDLLITVMALGQEQQVRDMVRYLGFSL